MANKITEDIRKKLYELGEKIIIELGVELVLKGRTSSANKSRLISQAEVNIYVQVNVNHLKTILAYTPAGAMDDTPDIVGYSGDKSSYTGAITTGEAYIAANS